MGIDNSDGNNWVLVTGAASGIGCDLAQSLVEKGERVIALDRDEGKLNKVYNDSSASLVCRCLDVCDVDVAAKTVEMIREEIGMIKGLVNCAGIYPVTAFLDIAVEEWDQVMAVNAKGVFLGTKHVLGEMRKAGGGSIINISSTLGLVGSYRSAAYTASKGAVRLLTKSTAIQYLSLIHI